MSVSGTDGSGIGYPVRLPLHGRPVTVVGGGAAAARKVAELRAAGAQILVIGAGLTDELDALASAGLISARRRDYRPADLDGAWLALACSDDPLVNEEVARDANRRRIWCLPAGEPGKRVLILGGARSGKSTAAEAMLTGLGPVEYVATGPKPGQGDREWDTRVAEHRKRRPADWRTTETLDIDVILGDQNARSPVLIDCLATWLTGIMDACGVWDDTAGVVSAGGVVGGAVSADAGERLATRVDALVASWRLTRRRVVAVSNEVGSGVVPPTASGRRFRDELGLLNARLAGLADEVWICVAGIASRLR
jgi:adenosyl cobinamide kinase/adenosyl cobinamide phosphate guanylyltransferase